MRVTVIGIGQTFRGDDAAGLEAVRRWENAHAGTALHAAVTVQYSELPGLALLDLLQGFDVAIIVDAVGVMATAGKVYRLGLDDLAAFEAGSKSAHGWGVAETLKLGAQLGILPSGLRVRLVGIGAEQIGIGQPLSAAVVSALPAVCEAIKSEVQQALS